MVRLIGTIKGIISVPVGFQFQNGSINRAGLNLAGTVSTGFNSKMVRLIG